MPDCSTLIIDATWVSGWVNWREYWMNACTSPMLIAPLAHPQAADHGDGHVVEVAEEHHRRLDRCPEMNWAPKLASYSSSFLSSEALLDLALAAEHLHERVAGEGLLDLGVERAGVAPLRDEARASSGSAMSRIVKIDSGIVTSATQRQQRRDR